MRYLLLLLLLLMLTAMSCTVQQPITSEPSHNNQDYCVDYLFEHDGCKVYRFWDRSYYVYFTNCTGEAIARTDSTAVRNEMRLVKP
ncbi:MAG TPA: DUF4884 domain-containing protein [Puia sp.]|nr:DUF4884 domain-containing protein [Puia sp.]